MHLIVFNLLEKKISFKDTKLGVIGWVVTIAIFLRLVFYFAILLENPEDGFLSYDSYGYINLSKNIVEHQLFSRVGEGILYHDIYRTPVYPVFVLIFNGIEFAVLVQIIVSALSCYLLYCICLKIGISKNCSSIAGLFLALDLPSIVHVNLIMTEILFQFLLLISVYFLLKLKEVNNNLWVFLSGGLLGLSILCRPIGQYLPLLFLFYIVFKNIKIEKIKQGFIFIVGLLLVLIPWMHRNNNIFGAFIISSSGPINFCSWQISNILSKKNNVPIHEARADFWQKTYLREGLKNRSPYDIGVLKSAMTKSFEIIGNNKALFFKQHLRGVGNVLLKPVRRDLEVQLGYQKGYDFGQIEDSDFTHANRMISSSSYFVKFLIYFQVMHLILLYAGIGLFFIHCKKWLSKSFLKYGFIILLCLYFLNLNTPPVSNSRLRVPLVPFLIILSVSGVYFQRLGRKYRIEKKTQLS